MRSNRSPQDDGNLVCRKQGFGFQVCAEIYYPRIEILSFALQKLYKSSEGRLFLTLCSTILCIWREHG